MLHPTSCDHDPVPIRVTEPPIVALTPHEDVTLWRFDDGSVVIRIGSAVEIGADTILIESHLLPAVLAGLQSAGDDEDRSAP